MRETKMKTWKGKIAVILVLALILTSVSIPRQMSVTVEAATEPTMPSSGAIGIGDAATFAYYMIEYANDAGLDTPQYPNGLVLQLEADIDLSDVEAFIPEGKIWILMNGHSIWNAPQGMLDIGYAKDNLPESEDYVYYLNFSGEGSIRWRNEDETQLDEAVTEAYIYPGAKIVVSGVDMETTRFVVAEGADLNVEGIDYSNPLDSAYIQYYCGKEAAYRLYENVYVTDLEGNTASYPSSFLYYNTIYEGLLPATTDTGYVCAVDTLLPTNVSGVDRIIYDENAFAAFPDDVTYTYEGNSYTMPATTFVVDDEYGVYTLTENGKTMTFYACVSYNSEMYMDIEPRITGYDEENNPIREDVACIDITRNFTPYVPENVYTKSITTEDGITVKLQTVDMVQATAVHFMEGSLPVTYTEEDITYPVKKVHLYEYNIPYCIDFTFDVEANGDMDIFNRTRAAVTASKDAHVWVHFSTGSLTSNASLTTDTSQLSEISDGIESGSYALAGSSVIIKPVNEGDTIYDIQVGGFSYSEDMGEYDYSYGRRGDDYVTHYTNGSRKITVPNFSGNVAVTVSEMSETRIENNPDYPSVEYEFSAERVYNETYMNPENSSETIYEDWYNEDFTLSGGECVVESTENYYYNFEICDETMYAATAENVEWPTTGVKISEEGTEITKTFKIINFTEKETFDIYDEDFDGDTTELIQIPAVGYGCESWITYTYTMDKTSPIITDVIATDADGNELQLSAGWFDGTGDVPVVDTVWSKVSPVSVGIIADDGEQGTGVFSYKFDILKQPDSAWIEDSFAELEADGIYSLELKARDWLQNYLNEEPNEKWIASIGIDTVAPYINYTDALNADAKELQSNTIYQGNLYVEVVEDTSGLKQIQLYENVDGSWQVNDEVLVEVAASEDTGYLRYYISPADEDKVYRITVVDEAGNETSYDNLTIAGYEQDIEVTVGTTTQVYGKELVIPITITNISEDVLQLDQISLREEVSASSFTLEADITSELAAGATAEITLKLAEGIDAGDYEAVLDFVYTNMSDNIHLTMDKAYSETITATVEKAAGSGTFTIADFYYGETLTPVLESATNGVEGVTILYKDKNDLSAQYTEEIPTSVGSYQAKAEFKESKNYKKLTIETSFNITRMEATSDMYTITELPEENEWYTTDVTISAVNGNQLSATENGVYVAKLTIKESMEAYSFYVKTATGAITEAVVLSNINIDKTAPEVGEEEGIYVVENWWQTFLETITFGIYQTDAETIQIKAHDDESGMASISYYISDTALSLEEVMGLDTWTTGTEFTIDVSEPRNYVIYARLENAAGLVNYISTNGIVIEKGIIKTSGVAYLETETAYEFGEGSWQVTGDDTVYAGGNTFFVLESGEYEFSVVE